MAVGVRFDAGRGTEIGFELLESVGAFRPSWFMDCQPDYPEFPKLKEMATVGGRIRMSIDGGDDTEFEILSIAEREGGGLILEIAKVLS